ncbi:hypothetical protein DPMN_166034 [Dreissena polymorpha]|uniref:C1q domain-containing protein n=1 Tax=Dreissena polymorpha TaxID=45954 RepID=A0A9D4EYQ2_DREPO|nr:hypothetical protein DPMN_166034 [Dreissena polymorpha]
MKLQKKGLLLLLNVILAACAREPLSPTCMLYEYEERLLERVLRNEIGLENTLKDIVKTHAKVEDALQQLEDGTVLIKSTLKAIEEKQTTMESTLHEFMENVMRHVNLTVNTSLSTLENNHEAMVVKSRSLVADVILELTENVTATIQRVENVQEALKAQSIIPTIYFRSRLAYSVNPSSGKDVIFPTVDVNEGHCYNPSTGKFNASVSGMYIFSVQYCCQAGQYSYMTIKHKGNTLQASSCYATNDYHCVTMQAPAKLAIGDQVSVQVGSQGFLLYDYQRYTSFSGTLSHL